jgi:hypothetical protein
LRHNSFTGVEDFFAALAHQTFVDLTGDETELRLAMADRWPNISVPVSEAVRKLSAIIFLHDENVVQQSTYINTHPMTVTSAYFFRNTNADAANNAEVTLRTPVDRAQRNGLSVQYREL